MPEPFAGTPILEIRGLNVFYGASHALQGVDLRLNSGVLSVVGRNGMGKTTLCNAIMGISPPRARGSIRFEGSELVGVVGDQVAEPPQDVGSPRRTGVTPSRTSVRAGSSGDCP